MPSSGVPAQLPPYHRPAGWTKEQPLGLRGCRSALLSPDHTLTLGSSSPCWDGVTSFQTQWFEPMSYHTLQQAFLAPVCCFTKPKLTPFSHWSRDINADFLEKQQFTACRLPPRLKLWCLLVSITRQQAQRVPKAPISLSAVPGPPSVLPVLTDLAQ